MKSKKSELFNRYFWFYYLFALILGIIGIIESFYAFLLNEIIVNGLLKQGAIIFNNLTSVLSFAFTIFSIASFISFKKRNYATDTRTLPLFQIFLLCAGLFSGLILLVLYLTNNNEARNSNVIVHFVFSLTYALIVVILSARIFKKYKFRFKDEIKKEVIKKLLLVFFILLIFSSMMLIKTESFLLNFIQLCLLIIGIISINKIVKPMNIP